VHRQNWHSPPRRRSACNTAGWTTFWMLNALFCAPVQASRLPAHHLLPYKAISNRNAFSKLRVAAGAATRAAAQALRTLGTGADQLGWTSPPVSPVPTANLLFRFLASRYVVIFFFFLQISSAFIPRQRPSLTLPLIPSQTATEASEMLTAKLKPSHSTLHLWVYPAGNLRMEQDKKAKSKCASEIWLSLLAFDKTSYPAKVSSWHVMN